MARMKIRYKGAADTRIMSQDDLKKVGVDVPEDLVFSRANLWSMDVEMTDQLEQVLRMDGAFRLEALNDDGTVTREHEGTVIDDTGNTVVDQTTGQTSVKE